MPERGWEGTYIIILEAINPFDDFFYFELTYILT